MLPGAADTEIRVTIITELRRLRLLDLHPESGTAQGPSCPPSTRQSASSRPAGPSRPAASFCPPSAGKASPTHPTPGVQRSRPALSPNALTPRLHATSHTHDLESVRMVPNYPEPTPSDPKAL
ncbi:hypothetical protein GCM10009755_10090 [Brevibacterium samyangense]|uniref:Uncharacterized protein n=1 Tax=Brevibacterium samyangense TaxID=366888 RepID=A0ABN2TA69_9MICO